MALSPELISQFAKLVNKDKKTKVESTVYGTIVEDSDGNKYVKIDGSDQLTPLSNNERPSLDSTTADAKVGERVTVLIKNHTATVTGNVSSPAARAVDVADVKEAQILLAQQVQADQAYFKQLIADEATLGKLEAAEASIIDLIASTADIDKLLAEKITVTDLIAGKIDASVVEATYATIKSLEATDAKIGTLSADYADFKNVSTGKFTAYDADIKNLQTNSLTAEKADIAYAKIDFSNMIGVKIDEAAIEHLFASSGMVKDITIDNGVITGELIGVTLKGDLVEAGTLKADRLVVKGENGIYYKLNIEGGAVASAEVTEEQLQNGLSGSVIIAKSITAEKVSVSDLVAFGATIGGFQITKNSIHSVTKQTVNATTRGFYTDNDGQFNVGDETNFVKFFKDADGAYKLRISADSIVLGASKKNVEDAIEEVAESTKTNSEDLTKYIASTTKELENLQGQIDGSIMTWFYEYVPTNSNKPASDWNTTDLKNNHLGDLFYDTITGYCYRWQVQNNQYSWNRITDVDVTKALADAAKAQSTADNKRRVFVTTPTPPYDVGDLWTQGASGDLMRCQTAKTASQSYAAADWVKASKYTDDTAANAAQADANALKTRVTNAETRITQNEKDIALRATKTEVADTLKGYYTKTESDAALKVSADSVKTEVSKTYATKQEVSDIEIGGTNLLINSSFKEDLDKWNQAYPTNDNSILNIRETVSGTDIVSADVVSPEQNSSTVKLESVNLLPLSKIVAGVSTKVENGVVTQITADTREYFCLKVQTHLGSTYLDTIALDHTLDSFKVTVPFVKDSTFDRLAVGHNGETIDVICFLLLDDLPDGKYTLSMQITNATQGEFSWQDIMIVSDRSYVISQTHVVDSYDNTAYVASGVEGEYVLLTVTYTDGFWCDCADGSYFENYSNEVMYVGAKVFGYIDSEGAHHIYATKPIPYTPYVDVGGATSNLIPYPYVDTTTTSAGLTYTDNGDGSITINGTSTGVSYFVLATDRNLFEVGKTYTISGSTPELVLDVLFQNVVWAGGGTFTVTEAMMNATNIDIEFRIPSGITASNVTVWPMLNEGATAYPYIPYGESRGAAVTVCGKNLLSPLTKGVRIDPITGKAYVDTTTAASTDYIRIDSTENYYIAGMPNDLYCFVAAYDVNKNFLGRTGAGTVYVTPRNIIDLLNMTAEAKQTVRFIRVTVYENSNASGVIANLDNATPFIVKGSDSQTYEPYTATNYFADELGNVTITDPVSPKMTVISDVLGVNMDLSYKLISGFVTKAGKPCLNIKHLEFNITKRVHQEILHKIERGSTYTFSGWFLTENIVAGPTNYFLHVYAEGVYINSENVLTWFGGFRSYVIPQDTSGQWQYISFVITTDHVPETATSVTLHIFTRDMTGDLYFRDLKLEKGNKATDWSPAPEDAELEITKLESSLSTTAEGIVAQVSSSYVSKDEFGTYRESANTKVEQTAQGLKVSIDGLQETINKGEFEQVKVSGKNYVMDANGFTIGSNDENDKLNTTISEDGMTVKNDGSEVLTATSEGVEAKDLHAKTYLIIGNNSRFEDYNGNRTACFWIGS